MMSLTFYNQLTKKIDEFVPIHPGAVSLYTCGPTVYNYLHIGNWASYIYWDTLVRTLSQSGYTVDRVMNITDVGHLVSDADDGEDKLEKGARREGKSAWDVAAFYEADFLRGMERLHLVAPTHITEATKYIPEQLALVKRLQEKGYTYQITDGIYFDTAKFPTYADFAGLDLQALKAGARVEFNPEKRNPSDFALWKFTPAGETRDMQWETPPDMLEPATVPHEGAPVMGFPGWHIECSAMAMALLGETIDMHTGGIDHIPVHHTNEIAQSEAATGQPFSHYWLHNNHLKVQGTKISKSLENGYTLDEIEERGFALEDYKLFVLQSHYQHEGNFTFENLTAAHNRLLHWRNVAALRYQLPLRDDEDAAPAPENLQEPSFAASSAILAALADNLDTPAALAAVDEAFDKIEHTSLEHIDHDAFSELLVTIDALLGLRLIETTDDISSDAKDLISAREEARRQKDWHHADELRQQLLAIGTSIRDTEEGSIWGYAEEMTPS